MESPPGAETTIDGRPYLYFGGTSYLGLAARPEVIEAACDAVRRYGVHSATTRAGFGTNPATLAVERLAAEFFGTEQAFYYASGYAGNHVLIQALAERFDTVLIDELSHACLVEAAKLTGKPILSFRHRNADDLQADLRSCKLKGHRPLVISDGLFAVTGAMALLGRYCELLAQCGTATLLIDDAHGFGTVGQNGRGTLEHFGLWDKINAEVKTDGLSIFVSGTLSKALGGYGGILPCSGQLLEKIRQTSHYFDGASAPASSVAGASAKALEIVLREPQLRERLASNVAKLRQGLVQLGLPVEVSPSPVIGLSIGHADNMRRIHQELKAAGILLPYSTYGGSGKEGILRLAVFATHSEEMLDRLLGELASIV